MSEINSVERFVDAIFKEILAETPSKDVLKINSLLFSVRGFDANCGMIILYDFYMTDAETHSDNSEFLYEIVDNPTKESDFYNDLFDAALRSTTLLVRRMFRTEDFSCAVFTVNQDQDFHVHLMETIVQYINKNLSQLSKPFYSKYNKDTQVLIQNKHEFININTGNDISVYFITIEN
jgi:hypothetical protein